ncbi:MAG TPA: tetratricopeptide repeat protein [Rhodocyclaceae bacterium]|nr:tetratricopeptide repeat protein [Rhodocyclaceae bacterium]
MSLLMDALKKAEEAKRQAVGEGAPQVTAEAPADLELTPLESEGARAPAGAGTGGRATLPELPNRLEDLDRQFERPAPPRRRTPSESPSRTADGESADAAAEMAAARQLFEAKQPGTERRPFAAIAVALGIVGAGAIGGWYWWQTRPSGTQPLVPPTGAHNPVPPPKPLAPAASPAPTEAAEPSTAKSVAVAGGEIALAPPKARVATESRPPEARLPEPPPTPQSPVRISTSRLQVNAGVAAAFDAFSAGRMDQARLEYERVLKGEPRNTDALVGLASVALRQGRPEEAEDLYFRAAESDPKDAVAVAGLIGLRGRADPLQAETRLKTLISGQPDQASLHFALGNLHSRQSRWSDAQQSYFKAFTLDPDNPDVVYNLAVSLDHLHQVKLAVQYYNQALTMADTRPAAFDRAGLTARLRELQDR